MSAGFIAAGAELLMYQVKRGGRGAHLEQLERRRMLADAWASVIGGALTVNGTSEADTISVSASGGNVIATRGADSMIFPADSVWRISVATGAGDDSVVISAPLPATILGEDGSDNLK